MIFCLCVASVCCIAMKGLYVVNIGYVLPNARVIYYIYSPHGVYFALFKGYKQFLYITLVIGCIESSN